MGKSSSSLKKIKRSKDSSKRKKTKRNKSKKIRRLKDHSDDSELSGSDSSSYSSSEEDDYRRKKHRSKVSRKRSRRRYSSTESDDDTRPLKKKKKSKKKNDYVGKKKKIGSRKRPERDNGSTSSESCPASDNRSSSSGSESDKERGKLGKVKARKRRSKDRLGDSESDECWHVEDEVLRENNPRRLRSVIVIPDAYDNDEREEEIVQVQDAYGARRDGETTISYAGPGADEEGRRSVEFGEDIRFETSKAPHSDDLEAILKKRALENLKIFRGASKKVSSAAEGDPLQNQYQIIEKSQDHGLMEQELHVSADSRDVESTRKILQGVDDVRESRSTMTDLASLQDQQSNDPAKVKVSSGISTSTTRRKLIRPVWGRESVNTASEKLAIDCQNAKTESTNDKDLPDCSPGTKNRSENRESRNVNTTNDEQPSSCAETEALDETREASKLEHKTQDETKEASESEHKSIDETKDGSQYEQKTMTVMRGGEMVQVSYKVYIPKKTSALGRRQLRR